MKKIILFLLISLLSLPVYSQLKSENHYLGGSVGFWVKGSTPIWGANYEYTFPQDKIGLFAAGGIFRYWSYAEKYNNDYESSITNLVFAGQINYHFNSIGSGVFVPYAGLVAGFNNATTKYTAFDQSSVIGKKDAEYKNGFILWAQAGFRYFFTPKVAGSIRLGLGNLDFSTIEFGVDFNL